MVVSLVEFSIFLFLFCYVKRTCCVGILLSYYKELNFVFKSILSAKVTTICTTTTTTKVTNNKYNIGNCNFSSSSSTNPPLCGIQLYIINIQFYYTILMNGRIYLTVILKKKNVLYENKYFTRGTWSWRGNLIVKPQPKAIMILREMKGEEEVYGTR